MPKLSDASSKKLATCAFPLQRLVEEVVKIADLTVVCGHRENVDQVLMCEKGLSRACDGTGKHLSFPSAAIDIAPSPINYAETELARARFYVLAGMMLAIAAKLSIRIRWGGDWDGDGDFEDQQFHDLGHFELMP